MTAKVAGRNALIGFSTRRKTCLRRRGHWHVVIMQVGRRPDVGKEHPLSQGKAAQIAGIACELELNSNWAEP